MKKLLFILSIFITSISYGQSIPDTVFLKIKGGGGTIDSLNVSKLNGGKIDTSHIPISNIYIDQLGSGVSTLRGSNDSLHSATIGGAGTVSVTKQADSSILITGSSQWLRNGYVLSPLNTIDTVQIGASNYVTTGAGTILNVGGNQINYSPNNQLTLTDTTIYVSGIQQKGSLQLNARLQNGHYGTLSTLRWYMIDSTSDYPTPPEDHGYGTIAFVSHGLDGSNYTPLALSGQDIQLGKNSSYDMRTNPASVTIGGYSLNTGKSPFEMRAYDGSVWWQKAYINGNMSFGKNTDNGIGKVQVNGRLTVDTLVTGANTDSIVVVNSNQFKKIKNTIGNGADSIKHLFVDTSANPRNGYVMSFDSVNHKWYLAAPGSGGGTSYTFSTGLTNTSGTVTANIATGVSGGQTAIGGTGVADALNLKGTTGNGTLTSPAINLLVGNNGGTNGITVLNNGKVGFGTTSPASNLDIVGSAGTSVQIIAPDAYGSGFNLVKSSNKQWQFSMLATTNDFNMLYYNGSTFIHPFNILSSNGNVGINTTTPNSTQQIVGSLSTAYIAKTANYTATINDYTIDCTANTFTVTLPTAVGISGRIYTIINSGSGTVTIATTSSQTFTNVTATPTTLTMAALGTYQVQSTGANWIVISKL